MNMVSRAGKLSLPLAYGSSRQSDLFGKCGPGTDTRNALKYLAPGYDCGGGYAITLLAFASKCLAMMQMRLSRPYDSVLLQCQIGN
jgi:hypothetical protein